MLALKGNQSGLHREVREYFEEAKKQDYPDAMPVSRHEESAVGHDRKEVRRCIVSTDVEWLESYGEWTGLQSIALVEYRWNVYSGEDAQAEHRFYISSLACGPRSCSRQREGTGRSKTKCIGCWTRELRRRRLTHSPSRRSRKLLAPAQNGAEPAAQ